MEKSKWESLISPDTQVHIDAENKKVYVETNEMVVLSFEQVQALYDLIFTKDPA